MNGLFEELMNAFGKKTAEEIMEYIIMGYSVDAAIQEVICEEFE